MFASLESDLRKWEAMNSHFLEQVSVKKLFAALLGLAAMLATPMIAQASHHVHHHHHHHLGK